MRTFRSPSGDPFDIGLGTYAPGSGRKFFVRLSLRLRVCLGGQQLLGLVACTAFGGVSKPGK